MITAWLTDGEVDDMCAPLTQNAAKVKYLRDNLHLQVMTKPNGRPLVLRSNLETVLGGLPAPSAPGRQPAISRPPQPDVAGLVLAFGRKGA
jgi:hypothetical protein